MARITYSRWWDNEIGEDSVDRVSRAPVREQPGAVVSRPAPPRPDGQTQPPEPVTTQEQNKKIVSQESGVAPFDTIWHDFNLEAIPFYNFWEQEEEISFVNRDTQELVDLPRYVKLSWNKAPEIRDPDEFKKRAMSRGSPDSRFKFIQLSPFGFGANMAVGSSVNGSNFTPAHLQPDSFPENVAKCANGFISSGVVNSVVSVPVAAVTTPEQPTSSIIDEDSYLENHKKYWGISYSEMNASLWRRRSSIFGSQQMFGRRNSKALDNNNTALVQGQFGISPHNSDDNSTSMVAGVTSAVSHNGKSALSSRNNRKSRVSELAGDEANRGVKKKNKHVRTNFIHTNFSGLLTQERVDTATEPQHLESTVALAQNAADLVAYANAGYQNYKRDMSIPYDRAPANLNSLEYIGYVIEKWESVDGIYKLIDTFNIPGREYTDFYDAEVKYGVDYRYRIRAILRWCRPHGVGVLGKDPTVIDPPGSNIDSMTPNDVSYFHSEWSHEWAHAFVIDRSPPNPPDELVVMPRSETQSVVVTFKLPHNPQRDINKMLLLRKIQDDDGVDTTDWIPVKEFSEDLSERQGTRTTYLTNFEHQQDDITGTKFNVTQTVVTDNIVEYGPANGRFEDYDVSYWGDGNQHRYVYAAVCFTRHGEQSTLSDQLACRLNKDWKKTGEFPIDFVSCAGVDADLDSGAFSTYPEKRFRNEFITKPDVQNNQPAVIGVTAQERIAKKALGNSSYVVRVESLDTGQAFDIPLTLTVNNMQEERQVVQYQNLVAVRKESAA
jgi:hypothetical protein